jgi:hypothetical protein
MLLAGISQNRLARNCIRSLTPYYGTSLKCPRIICSGNTASTFTAVFPNIVGINSAAKQGANLDAAFDILPDEKIHEPKIRR